MLPIFDPTMSPKHNQQNSKVFIKFGVPTSLKNTLQKLANERNIGLSALLRLISTEYLRRNQSP
jgi:hypothetical protein